jgi:hypothetical protein
MRTLLSMINEKNLNEIKKVIIESFDSSIDKLKPVKDKLEQS